MKEVKNMFKWTEENINILKDNYGKISIKELAELLGTTYKSVTWKAYSMKLTNNVKDKDRGNLRIFKNIDCEISAYWLGFIYADGYVIYKLGENSKNSYEVGISLNSKDKEHLEKFSNIFNKYYKVKTRKRNIKFDNYDTYNTEFCEIRIHSKDMVLDLINNNIVPNKTYSTKFPIVEDKTLFLHFLRGFIDGDGYYTLRMRATSSGKIMGYPRIGLCNNNRDFLQYVSERLYTDFGINAHIHKSRNMWKLQIDSYIQVEILIDKMYKNATIFLDRKYDKILKIKENAVLHRNMLDN